jgi:hypothetical protein
VLLQTPNGTLDKLVTASHGSATNDARFHRTVQLHRPNQRPLQPWIETALTINVIIETFPQSQ